MLPFKILMALLCFEREIWMANIEPIVGSEQAGTRPVIIISGPSMNAHYPVIFVCLLTT